MDLTQILKKIPKGTHFFDRFRGAEVVFESLCDADNFPIRCLTKNNCHVIYTKEGKIFDSKDAMVALIPSKEQEDWSKYVVRPWYLEAGKSYVCIKDFYNCAGVQLATKGKVYNSPNGYWIVNDKGGTIMSSDKLYECFIPGNEIEIENIEIRTDFMVTPFTKVLMRDSENELWFATLISHITEGLFPYVDCAGVKHKECILYNDYTRPLLGTSIKSVFTYNLKMKETIN